MVGFMEAILFFWIVEHMKMNTEDGYNKTCCDSRVTYQLRKRWHGLLTVNKDLLFLLPSFLIGYRL